MIKSPNKSAPPRPVVDPFVDGVTFVSEEESNNEFWVPSKRGMDGNGCMMGGESAFPRESRSNNTFAPPVEG